jgi:hypothetical protein
MHKAVLMFISQILASRRETESFQFCTFGRKKIEKKYLAFICDKFTIKTKNSFISHDCDHDPYLFPNICSQVHSRSEIAFQFALIVESCSSLTVVL